MSVSPTVLREIQRFGSMTAEAREHDERRKVVDPFPGSPASCACETCQRACMHKPGWFLPGEAEAAAAFLGIDLPEFFRTYCVADHWPEIDGDVRTLVLSPAPTYLAAGTRTEIWQRGQCVFFRHGRCRIYPVRPDECRRQHHSVSGGEMAATHQAIRDAWQGKAHQHQVLELIGVPSLAPPAARDVPDRVGTDARKEMRMSQDDTHPAGAPPDAVDGETQDAPPAEGAAEQQEGEKKKDE